MRVSRHDCGAVECTSADRRQRANSLLKKVPCERSHVWSNRLQWQVWREEIGGGGVSEDIPASKSVSYVRAGGERDVICLQCLTRMEDILVLTSSKEATDVVHGMIFQ